MKRKVVKAMTKPESIARIKETLEAIKNKEDPYVKGLQADTGQGVQKVVVQFDKKWGKFLQLQ